MLTDCSSSSSSSSSVRELLELDDILVWIKIGNINPILNTEKMAPIRALQSSLRASQSHWIVDYR